MVGRSRQGTNQEGGLIPHVSPWGQTLKSATKRLIDRPSPIGTTPNINFGGTAGAVMTVAASTKTVLGTFAYWGDIPQSEQAVVAVSPPWERP